MPYENMWQEILSGIRTKKDTDETYYGGDYSYMKNKRASRNRKRKFTGFQGKSGTMGRSSMAKRMRSGKGTPSLAMKMRQQLDARKARKYAQAGQAGGHYDTGGNLKGYYRAGGHYDVSGRPKTTTSSRLRLTSGRRSGYRQRGTRTRRSGRRQGSSPVIFA